MVLKEEGCVLNQAIWMQGRYALEQGAVCQRKRCSLEVLILGLATDSNTSRYKLLIEKNLKKGKILTSNQVSFDETFFPRRNRHMIHDHLSNID